MTYIISPKIVTVDTLNSLLELVRLQPVAMPLFARLISEDGKRWFLASYLDDDIPKTRIGREASIFLLACLHSLEGIYGMGGGEFLGPKPISCAHIICCVTFSYPCKHGVFLSKHPFSIFSTKLRTCCNLTQLRNVISHSHLLSAVYACQDTLRIPYIVIECQIRHFTNTLTT